MKPVLHHSNNRVLGAPEGWDQSKMECEAIGITDREVLGMKCVVSFWQPSPSELARLNSGHAVTLSIVGNTMPPVCVSVEEQ